jgi:HK97 family phage major capsid protein
MNRLQEIEARNLEIRAILESDETADLDSLETELRAMQEEKKEIEKRAEIAAGINAGIVPAQKIEIREERKMNFEGMEKDQIVSTPEYRSAYLKDLQGKKLTEVEQRVLTTAGDSAGAAVPTTTLNQIIDKLRQSSALFPFISATYIPGNLSLAVANAKNAASWKAEGTDGTPADDTVENVNLAGYELIKLVEISAAASAMTIDAFEAYIAAEIGRQMAIAVENAIVSGDGDGQPTGILEGVDWDSDNTATWANGSVVDYDSIVDGISKLPTMYHQNARFAMNREMFWAGIRKIKDENENPIFTYNPQDGVSGTIFGYPVVIDDYVPDDLILFGDFSYYYMNFSKAPELARSEQAGFKSGKITYRGLAVADGKPALSEAFVKIEEAASE